jgi:hypothetical protein
MTFWIASRTIITGNKVGLNARVQLYLAGSPADEYRIITDDQGRTIEEGIRTWPRLELKTVLTYDGDTERTLKAEVLQNGQVRATYQRWEHSSGPQGIGC